MVTWPSVDIVPAHRLRGKMWGRSKRRSDGSIGCSGWLGWERRGGGREWLCKEEGTGCRLNEAGERESDERDRERTGSREGQETWGEREGTSCYRGKDRSLLTRAWPLAAHEPRGDPAHSRLALPPPSLCPGPMGAASNDLRESPGNLVFYSYLSVAPSSLMGSVTSISTFLNYKRYLRTFFLAFPKPHSLAFKTVKAESSIKSSILQFPTFIEWTS